MSLGGGLPINSFRDPDNGWGHHINRNVTVTVGTPGNDPPGVSDTPAGVTAELLYRWTAAADRAADAIVVVAIVVAVVVVETADERIALGGIVCIPLGVPRRK